MRSILTDDAISSLWMEDAASRVRTMTWATLLRWLARSTSLPWMALLAPPTPASAQCRLGETLSSRAASRSFRPFRLAQTVDLQQVTSLAAHCGQVWEASDRSPHQP